MDSFYASSAAGASSDRLPNWVMLDPFVRVNDGKDLGEHGDTYADDFTSTGERIGFVFWKVPPPGASRLYVSWKPPGQDNAESSAQRRRAFVEPQVVAAHRDSILLKVAGSGPRADYFLYMVHSDGRPPSLFRLPTCELTMQSASFTNGWISHMLRVTCIGLLCHGDEEYVIADLQVLPETEEFPLEVQFCIFSSCDTTIGWHVKQPHVHYKKGQGRDLRYWETDVVIPYGDCLCYVDYYRGILFGDVLSSSPELRYLRLPVLDPSGYPVKPELGAREAQHLLRAVGVTKDGVMTFVDVVETTISTSGNRLVSSNFAIHLWKLRHENLTWEDEIVLKDSELWSMQGYGNLPHVVPELPIVSMEEPNVVYLVLRNDNQNDTDSDGVDECDDVDDCGDVDTWIIAVDMFNKTLQSCQKYADVDCFSDNDCDMGSINIAYNHAFIPYGLSKHLKMAETRKRKNP